MGGSGGDPVDAAIISEEILLGGGSTGVCASLFTHSIAPLIGVPLDADQLQARALRREHFGQDFGQDFGCGFRKEAEGTGRP